MPQYLKALATITVWILWIVSLVMGFGTMAMGIMRGELFNAAGPPHPMSYTAGFAVAAFYALVALYAMKVRSKME